MKELCQESADKERFARQFAVFLVGGLALASLANFSQVYPHFVDVNYHMAAVEGFRQAGGLPLWSFWEFGPGGRPQVYPPVVHIAGLLTGQVGLSPYAYVTLLSWLMVPLSFVLAWAFVRDAAGPAAALVAVAFLGGSQAWFFNQAAHTANAVALCLALGALIAYGRGRLAAAAALSLLAAGSHGAGWVAPAAILLAAAPWPRRLLARALPVAAVSAVGWAPWLWHMAKQQALVTPRPGVLQMEAFRLDFVLMALAAAGLVASLAQTWRLARNGRGEEAARLALVPALLPAFGVMFPMHYGHRFWGFNYVLPYACLAGVGGAGLCGLLERHWKKLAPEAALAALALVALLVWPVVHLAPARPAGEQQPPRTQEPPRKVVRFTPPAVVGLLTGRQEGPGAARGGNSKESVEFLLKAREHIGPGDLVFAHGPEAALVTGLTGAWTTGGMLGEVQSPQPPARPQECDYVVELPVAEGPGGGLRLPPGVPDRRPAQPARPAPPGFEAVLAHGGGRLLKNVNDVADAPPRPAAVPTWLLALSAAGLAAIVLADAAGGALRRRARWCIVLAGAALFAVAWAALAVAVAGEPAAQKPTWQRPPGQQPQPGPAAGPLPVAPEPPYRPAPQGARPVLPQDIAQKVQAVRGAVRRMLEAGRNPDYFWPPERDRQLDALLAARRWDDARQLLDEGLRAYAAGPPSRAPRP